MKLPLPKCDRILPYHQAFWNTVKGGSDTITKLIDSVEEQLGIRTPSACVTARFLLLHAVAFQRSFQMLTADPELDYPTLYHYRQAASKRASTWESLEKIVSKFRECSSRGTFSLASSVATGGEGSSSPFQEGEQSMPPAANLPQRPRRNDQAQVAEKNGWLPRVAHNITPSRGRPRLAKGQVANVAHSANEIRAAECNGLVLVSSVKDPSNNSGKLVPHRKACALCGKMIDALCLGCKRHLCIDKDRSKVLVEKHGQTGLPGIDDFATNTFCFQQEKSTRKLGRKAQKHFMQCEVATMCT